MLQRQKLLVVGKLGRTLNEPSPFVGRARVEAAQCPTEEGRNGGRLRRERFFELVEGVGVTQNRHHRFDVWEHTMAAVDGTPGGALVRLGTLLHDVGKPRTAAPKADAPGENTFYRHDEVGAEMADAIGRRLKLSNAERERVVALVAHHMFWYSPAWSDGTVRRFIRRVGADLLPDLFAHPTVWSWFGLGYLFVPLVLPFFGLWWLVTHRPVVNGVAPEPATVGA